MGETFESARQYIQNAAEKGYFNAATMRYLWVENTISNIMLFLFIGAAVLYFIHVLFPKRTFNVTVGKLATLIIIVAMLAQVVTIAWRVGLTMRGPFQSLYESLHWFILMIGIVYLYVENRLKMKLPGVIVSLMLFGSLKFALTREPYITPWFPPNQSHWFLIHVACAFTSYAVFMVAFATEVSYLIIGKIGFLKRGAAFGYGEESLPRIREMTWKLARFGFPLLTFTIFGGAVWANDTWGRYWSWDPKEVWAAITWVFYAFYIHTMVHPKWRGSRSSTIIILSFIAMMITFIGISLLVKMFGLESFHAYAL